MNMIYMIIKLWSIGLRHRRTVAALIPSWLLYPVTLQVILGLRQLGSVPHG